ncbi:MAG TPA: tRNA 2-selenouridine(34) synthase MnmH [Saprospiraceae bacterium]|nr:tRNA 2-selenouridine(34) synthase MnmH [Saprospiraceae bacterium]
MTNFCFISSLEITKELWNSVCVLDVRSPQEFYEGHLPGAISFPLFDDDQRREVGICYKNEGKQKAILLGMKLIQNKLDQLILQADSISLGKPLVVYCWRGGMRSNAIAWLLSLYGMNVTVIEGGYKTFRNQWREYFEKKNFKICIIAGKTGAAKTEIIKELKLLHQQVIDLEALANHKGSAFGWIAEKQQPTNEQFENNLIFELMKVDENRILWLENESKRIGKITIPDYLWQKMQRADHLFIQRDEEFRKQHLIQTYSKTDPQDLIRSFQSIQRRLGFEACSNAIAFVEQNELNKAVDIALSYYDSCYAFDIEKNKLSKNIFLECYFQSNLEIAKRIVNEYGKC